MKLSTGLGIFILSGVMLFSACKEDPHALKNKLNVQHYNEYVGMIMVSRQDSARKSLKDRIALAQICMDGFLESNDENNYNKWKATKEELKTEESHVDLRTPLEKEYDDARRSGAISAYMTMEEFRQMKQNQATK